MMKTILRPVFLSALVLAAHCGGQPNAPTPQNPTPTVTASVYILPGAIALNDQAFGDEPLVIYKDERLRMVNADGVTHHIVADMPDATDFRNTDDLATGAQQLFDMEKTGMTKIHCSIHPNMTGTLIVRER